jgi:Zn-finger nucleic acid-binding protein
LGVKEELSMRTEAQVAGMHCPVCHVSLAMSDRQGIEIDYCPQCRGVWLDRGELDKIIERSAPQDAPPPAAPATAPPQSAPAQPVHLAPQPSAPLHQGSGHNPWGASGYTHGGYGHGHQGKPYKKRKSWLEDIFD